MIIHCPNCNSPIDSDPARCEVCGYRSDLVQEFFWLYLGGAAIALLGLAIGALGVIAQGAGPVHWSRALRGWFPLAPWPESHHWLAFVVVGILLSVSGLGITRRRPFAWIGLTLLVSYQLLWIVMAAVGLAGPGDVSGPAAILGGTGVLLLALLARICVALRRTPERDVHQMQLRAQGRQDSGDAARTDTAHAATERRDRDSQAPER